MPTLRNFPGRSVRETRGAKFLLRLWIDRASQIAIAATVASAVFTAWLGIQGSEQGFSHASWWYSRPALLLWLSLLITGLAGWTVERQRPRISQLESQLDEARRNADEAQEDAFNARQGYTELLEQQLGVMANNVLALGNTERISLYRHAGGNFTLLGRYSRNPEYRKPGRPHYPNNQGCIGEAWTNGTCEASNLPDPGGSLRRYQEVLRDSFGMPLAVTKGLNMRSRHVIAFRVENSETLPLGVVVIESTRTDVLEYGVLAHLFEASEGRRLAHFVEKIRPFEASRSVAAKRGL